MGQYKDRTQGESESEVILCFGTKFKLSIDLIQLLKVITVLQFTLRQCHVNCLWKGTYFISQSSVCYEKNTKVRKASADPDIGSTSTVYQRYYLTRAIGSR